MGTRMYAPSLGRFTTRDILTGDPLHPISLNQFVYGADSPVGMTDPTGMLNASLNSGGCQYKSLAKCGHVEHQLNKANPYMEPVPPPPPPPAPPANTGACSGFLGCLGHAASWTIHHPVVIVATVAAVAITVGTAGAGSEALVAAGEMDAAAIAGDVTAAAATDAAMAGEEAAATEAEVAAEETASAGESAASEPSTEWGRTIQSFRSGDEDFALRSVHAEASSSYPGGVSTESIYDYGDGQTLVHHEIYDVNDELVHETFRPYAKFGG